MQLCIRAHDLGVKGTENILRRLEELDYDEETATKEVKKYW